MKRASLHLRPAKSSFVDPLADVLRPGQSIELLKELHILTRDGKLNQDSRRKLKQVFHLCQFIEPLLDEVLSQQDTLTLADHGAGKSYLGFILYDLFLKDRPGAHIYGIETRDELVDKSRELAARLGFTRMSFLNETVAESITASTLPAAHRYRHRAARLQHRNRRRHPVRARQAGASYRAGALLPGRGCGRAAQTQERILRQNPAV